MTDDHYPYPPPRRGAGETLLNELRNLNREMLNLREAVHGGCGLGSEMESLREHLCKAVRDLGVIPKDDDDSPYLPPRSASTAILDELSNLRDEVRGVRDAVQGIKVGGLLALILVVLAVQAFCLLVLAYDIHHTLNPGS